MNRRPGDHVYRPGSSTNGDRAGRYINGLRRSARNVQRCCGHGRSSRRRRHHLLAHALRSGGDVSNEALVRIHSHAALARIRSRGGVLVHIHNQSAVPARIRRDAQRACLLTRT